LLASDLRVIESAEDDHGDFVGAGELLETAIEETPYESHGLLSLHAPVVVELVHLTAGLDQELDLA